MIHRSTSRFQCSERLVLSVTRSHGKDGDGIFCYYKDIIYVNISVGAGVEHGYTESPIKCFDGDTINTIKKLSV